MVRTAVKPTRTSPLTAHSPSRKQPPQQPRHPRLSAPPHAHHRRDWQCLACNHRARARACILLPPPPSTALYTRRSSRTSVFNVVVPRRLIIMYNVYETETQKRKNEMKTKNIRGGERTERASEREKENSNRRGEIKKKKKLRHRAERDVRVNLTARRRRRRPHAVRPNTRTHTHTPHRTTIIITRFEHEKCIE